MPTPPPPLVEVTLQSLKGFGIASPTHNIPKMTAAVSFSGSAADMQISSSFVCPSSGNLMVESHGATALPRTSTKSQPMIAQWHYNDNGASEQQQHHPPHASIYLPPQDPRLPRMPVSRSNRDGKVVEVVQSNEHDSSFKSNQPPSMDDSDVSSEQQSDSYLNVSSFTETNNTVLGESTDRGGSIIWSATGGVMPEIIELNVSIKVDADDEKKLLLEDRSGRSRQRGLMGGSSSHHRRRSRRMEHILQETPSLLDTSTGTWDDTDDEEDDDDDTNPSSSHHAESIHQVGLAYLVLFGNDGGTTLMDLPLKRISKNLPDFLAVDPNLASLRLCVNVYPHGKKHIPSSTKAATGCSGSTSSPRHHGYSNAMPFHANPAVLEPILRQLQLAEDRLVARKQRRRTNQNQNDDDKLLDTSPRKSSFLCGVMEVLTQCDGADEDGIHIAMHRNHSMDSSIDTAPSWMI